MSKKIALISLLLILIFVVTGCRTADKAKPAYDSPLLPGQSALRKITDPAQKVLAWCNISKRLLAAGERGRAIEALEPAKAVSGDVKRVFQQVKGLGFIGELRRY